MNTLDSGGKKTVIVLITALILVAAALVVIICNYIGFLKDRLVSDELSDINEILAQSTNDIHNTIHAEINVVKYTGRLIDPDNLEQTLDYLNEICLQQQFVYMGFVDKNGTGYTTDGRIEDYVHNEFFTHAVHGSDYVSEPRNENFQSMNILYSSPVYDSDNNIAGVVFAVSPDSLYIDILNYSAVSGSGRVYLASKSGAVLASSNENDINITDITDISSKSPMEVQNIKNNVAVLRSGMALIKADRGAEYVFYSPISEDSEQHTCISPVSDWVMMLNVPQRVIKSKLNHIMAYTIFVCTALFILFIFVGALNLSTQRESKKELELLAYYDFTTNGRNFNKFKLDARNMLLKHTNNNYAVITLDINHFKYINDMYGFDEGTRILKGIYHIADSSAAENEVVGRMNNDRFAFLFSYTDKAALQERIEQLCYDISIKNSYNFVFAIGIYEITDRKMNVDSMIDRAMIAMKSVRDIHQTTFAFYDDHLRNSILRERSIENDMHDSLLNEEFIVYYQPKYYIRNSELAGAETLVRWIHPKRGFMAPDEFIPLFEKSDFIIKLDHYVFEKNCKNMRKWMDENKKVVTISINFSRVHLNNPNCLDIYENMIQKYGIPPQYLEFEFTESAIFENSTTLVKMLDRIHSMGCSVSMDDFGTGYSSLNMLKEVPVDVLKLDKEFFSKSSDSNRGKDIIRAVVELARKLNIHVVAEGVEEEEQLKFLNAINCDIAQGYYFSKPIPTEEFEKLLI